MSNDKIIYIILYKDLNKLKEFLMKKHLLIVVLISLLTLGLILASCDNGNGNDIVSVNGDDDVINLYARGGNDWQEWISSNLFVKDFYSGVLEHGKSYIITFKGNLDTVLEYLKVEVEIAGSSYFHYGSAFTEHGVSLTIGPLDEAFLIEKINDPQGNLSSNAENVIVRFKTNHSGDPFNTANNGRIMARICDFSMTISDGVSQWWHGTYLGGSYIGSNPSNGYMFITLLGSFAIYNYNNAEGIANNISISSGSNITGDEDMTGIWVNLLWNGEKLGIIYRAIDDSMQGIGIGKGGVDEVLTNASGMSFTFNDINADDYPTSIPGGGWSGFKE